jgi:hypothetical protein
VPALVLSVAIGGNQGKESTVHFYVSLNSRMIAGRRSRSSAPAFVFFPQW